MEVIKIGRSLWRDALRASLKRQAGRQDEHGCNPHALAARDGDKGEV
jgi:hypothetical protein